MNKIISVVDWTIELRDGHKISGSWLITEEWAALPSLERQQRWEEMKAKEIKGIVRKMELATRPFVQDVEEAARGVVADVIVHWMGPGDRVRDLDEAAMLLARLDEAGLKVVRKEAGE